MKEKHSRLYVSYHKENGHLIMPHGILQQNGGAGGGGVGRRGGRGYGGAVYDPWKYSDTSCFILESKKQSEMHEMGVGGGGGGGGALFFFFFFAESLHLLGCLFYWKLAFIRLFCWKLAFIGLFVLLKACIHWAVCSAESLHSLGCLFYWKLAFIGLFVLLKACIHWAVCSAESLHSLGCLFC